MILGTFFGPWVRLPGNPWVGILAGIAAGAVGGLLHALITVTFGVDQIISGVGINLLVFGIAAYLKSYFGTRNANAGAVAKIADAAHRHDPGLARGCQTIEDQTGSWSPTSRASSAAGHHLSAVDHPRAAAAPRQLVHPLADVVRPAAALLRREPGRPPSPWVSTSSGTSTSRWWSPAAWPASAAASGHGRARASTRRARPAAADTSASPR